MSYRDERRDDRGRERDRISREERPRSRDRDRQRSRSREKDRASARDRSDRTRERERDSDRDKTKVRSRESERDKDRSNDKSKSRTEISSSDNTTKFSSVRFDSSVKKESSQSTTLPIKSSSSNALPEEEVDASDMEALEAFMNEGNESDEEQRLIEERKRRRQEILARHAQTSSEAKVITTAPVVTDDDYEDGNSNLSYKATSTATSVISSHALGGAIAGEPDKEEDLFQRIVAEKDAVEIENNARVNTTFDIFSSSPSDLELSKSNRALGANRSVKALPGGGRVDEEDNPHLQSNWDDSEGYYKCRIGEIINTRYRTLGVVGKGVFSTVLKCADLSKAIEESDGAAEMKEGARFESVAIKMIRNNDVMRKAADKELQILTLLSKHDPANKKHCVQLLEKFEYRQHTALVFEYLSMNLRETLKKFGKDVGINIGAIRLYMRQLLIALKHLSDLHIVHADIKLDNILCSADLKQVYLHPI